MFCIQNSLIGQDLITLFAPTIENLLLDNNNSMYKIFFSSKCGVVSVLELNMGILTNIHTNHNIVE